MICAGSSHPAPAAVNATPHQRALGYCPVCCRAHALTNAGRIWRHRTPRNTTPLPEATPMSHPLGRCDHHNDAGQQCTKIAMHNGGTGSNHLYPAMGDERHRVLGKLVAGVVEKRDHTVQIDGVLIAPCDTYGNLTPIITDDEATQQPPAELRERVLDTIPITTEYANALLAGHHSINRVDEATTIIHLARDRTRTNSLTDSQVNTVLSAAELLADEVDQQRIRAEAAEAERAELADALRDLDRHDR